MIYEFVFTTETRRHGENLITKIKRELNEREFINGSRHRATVLYPLLPFSVSPCLRGEI